jgi:hypothetical protein
MRRVFAEDSMFINNLSDSALRSCIAIIDSNGKSKSRISMEGSAPLVVDGTPTEEVMVKENLCVTNYRVRCTILHASSFDTRLSTTTTVAS